MGGSLCLVLLAFNCEAQVIGRAAPRASVAMPQLGLHTVADDSGRFAFDSVTDGRWGVEAHSPAGYALALATVRNGAAHVTLHAACGADSAESASTPVHQGAAPSRFVVRPAQPTPGTLIEMRIGGDSAQAIEGHVAGEPVRFRRDTNDTFVSLGGVPLDAGSKIRVALRYRYANGATVERDTSIAVNVAPIIAKAAAPREKLRVAAQFSQPPTSQLTRRIEGDGELANAVGAISLAMPPLWTQPFLRPRSSRITSGFASGRNFNGAVNARHTGVDFRGKVGDSVRATNRGVVALVDDTFLAGTVVYIAHGGGLVSGYFHLSATDVAIGDTVRRGQLIGRVGQSGRVTGPHLHWTVRYDHTTVDPMGVLSLGPLPREIAGACRGSDSPSR